MAKKNLGAIDSLLDGVAPQTELTEVEPQTDNYPTPQKRGVGRPKKDSTPSEPNYKRTSLILDSEKMDKARAIAQIEGLTLKDIIDYALDVVIGRYEEKHGKVTEPTQKSLNDIF